MKKRRREDLINFFKSKLDERYPNKEDWNTPSDDIFFDAIQTINTTKRNKRNKYFSLLLLFITVIGIGLFTYRYISNTNSKMIELEQTITKLEIDNSNKIQGYITNQGTENSESKTANTGKIKSNKLSIQTILQSNYKNSASSNLNGFRTEKSNQAHFELQHSGIKGLYLNNSINHSESNTYTLIDSDKVVAQNSAALILNKLGIASLDLTSNDLQSPKSVIIESSKRMSSKFKLGMYVTNDWSSIGKSNIQLTSTQSLTKYDMPQRNLGFGTSLSYNITPKFSISTAIGYGTYSYISEYDEVFGYDKSNEVVESNYLIYPMDMSIITPLGSYETFSKLAIGNKDYNNSDIVDSHSKIIQSFSLLKLELGAKYNVLSTDKWNLSISLGLAYNGLTNRDNDMETSIMIDKNIVGEIKSKVDKMEADKNSFYSAYSRLGLSYQLNRKFELELSGGYNTSITSVVDRAKTNNQGSYFNDFQSRIGINYSF